MNEGMVARVEHDGLIAAEAKRCQTDDDTKRIRLRDDHPKVRVAESGRGDQERIAALHAVSGQCQAVDQREVFQFALDLRNLSLGLVAGGQNVAVLDG